jgi:hypothetical protein
MSKKKGLLLALLLLAAIGVVFLTTKIFCRPLPEDVEIKPSLVRVAKDDSGNFRLVVRKYNLRTGRYERERDYLIKGVVYQVVPVGQAPPWHENWMTSEADPARRARVDLNKDGQLTKEEPEIGDFQLMKEMGVNTIRLYESPGLKCAPEPFKVLKKEIEAARDILRELYSKYGIMTIMGHSLEPGADYADAQVRQRIHDEVLQMVQTYKDEPFVLIWNLGNENNIRQATTRGNFAENYYKKTVQSIAESIKKIDENHPVSISNMGLAGIYDFYDYCKDVDIYGANMYQATGYSGLWATARRIDKPAYLTEFGTDALDSRTTPRTVNEEAQAEWVKRQWKDIEANYLKGTGTSLGGVYFEWLDEWWKTGNPWTHTKEGGWDAPSFDAGTGESGNEEWWGICAQAESGEYSPIYRHLRKVYYALQELWKQ